VYKVVLLRHGESTWNKENRSYDIPPPPLIQDDPPWSGHAPRYKNLPPQACKVPSSGMPEVVRALLAPNRTILAWEV
jgi:bisphosphoglycerate-dependent phosphoglycerate mutase